MPPRNVVPKPKQKPHPPLWVACSRRETIDLAARSGMGALSFSFVEPEDAKPWVESYYSILDSPECVPAGFSVNPNLAVVVPFMCHEDEETAIERGLDGGHFFGYSLAHYYVFGRHRPGHSQLWDEFTRHRAERGLRPRRRCSADQQPLAVKVAQGALGSMRGAVGTPDQIAELCERYEAVGVDQVIFVAQAGRNRHEHICEAIELFGKDVVPRFADGRDEREAAKRERLAPAWSPPPRPAASTRPSGRHRGLRRRADRRADPGPDPADPPPAAARSLAPRKVVERSVQRGLALVLAAVPASVVRLVAGSRPAIGVYQRGMEQLLRGGELGHVKASVRVELADGDAVHAWTVTVAEGAVSSSRNGDRADATLRLGLDDWLGIIAGIENPGELLFDGRLAIDGDDAKALALFSALAADQSFY